MPNVTLIVKPGKDDTEEEKHRPKSLPNGDVKILNKIPANRIQQYIKRITCYHQVGVIPGMQGQCNICKSMTATHHVNKGSKSQGPLNTSRLRREKRHPPGRCALLPLCRRGQAGGRSKARAGTLWNSRSRFYNAADID